MGPRTERPLVDSGGLVSKVNDTCLPLDNNTFFLNQIFTQPKKADYSYYNNYSDTIVNHYIITVKIMLFHTTVNTLITVVLL